MDPWYPNAETKPLIKQMEIKKPDSPNLDPEVKMQGAELLTASVMNNLFNKLKLKGIVPELDLYDQKNVLIEPRKTKKSKK